jgi:hypothetical protein
MTAIDPKLSPVTVGYREAKTAGILAYREHWECLLRELTRQDISLFAAAEMRIEAGTRSKFPSLGVSCAPNLRESIRPGSVCRVRLRPVRSEIRCPSRWRSERLFAP